MSPDEAVDEMEEEEDDEDDDEEEPVVCANAEEPMLKSSKSEAVPAVLASILLRKGVLPIARRGKI